jgi:hypothetical protein
MLESRGIYREWSEVRMGLEKSLACIHEAIKDVSKALAKRSL